MPDTLAVQSKLFVITPPTKGRTTGQNLLRNADFADQTEWQNTPSLVVPNGWEFWYQTDTQVRLDKQDRPFEAPESTVWDSASASADEKAQFFINGEHCLKVGKERGVIWWKLSQTVSGLTVGQRYRLTVPIYPDVYMKLEGTTKVWADDPLAGEVRLTSTSGDLTVETGWLDGNKFPFGQYTNFTLDFVAKSAEAEIWIEARGRWGILNNGWVCQSPKLEAIGVAVAVAQSKAAPAQTGNLLQNANFAGGMAGPTPNLPGVLAPVGWTLWCADETAQKQAKQTESFRPPRAGVITAANVGADDKDGLTGGLAQAYRLVGNWRAIWFSLSQKVTGLTPNQRYTFTVQMLADPVEKYESPNNTKRFVADPDGGEVWLKVQSGGQATATLKRVNADFKPDTYVTFTHTFVAMGTEAVVTLEVRARFALTQNAWYVAAANLVAE